MLNGSELGQNRTKTRPKTEKTDQNRTKNRPKTEKTYQNRTKNRPNDVSSFILGAFGTDFLP